MTTTDTVDASVPSSDASTPLVDGALADGVAPFDAQDPCPRGVLTATSAATDFAIDGPFVYYVDSAAKGISRVPKMGGASELVVAEDRPVHNVVVDAEFVYWSSGTATGGSAIYRAPKTPPSAPTLLVAKKHYVDPLNPERFTYAISVNERFVSWAMPAQGVAWIDKANPTQGGHTDAPAAIWSTPRLLGVLSETAYVYWAGGEFLARAPFTTGATEFVEKISLDRLRAFAVDSSDVYWVRFNGADSSVLRVPKSDLPFQTLFIDHVAGAALAVDADAVYVTSASGILEVSKATRASKVIEPGNTDARTIVADGACVYYLTSGDGDARIVRVPK